MKKPSVAIIGGGASGMMAGIAAAAKGAEVTIYEKNDRIGKKILATGNGKCNFSNLVLDDTCYNGSGQNVVKSVLERFTPKDCMEFFRVRGMLIKDRNGYLYPASEQASTVLDLLRMQLSFLKIPVVTECEIISVQKTEKGGYLLTAVREGKKQEFKAQRVILAAGSVAGIPAKKAGKGACELLKGMDLPVVPLVPALVQLRCKEEFMKSVAGVRLDGEVTLYIEGKEVCRERGEVQLTDYGISGIPVFQLSRFAAYALLRKKNVQIHLNCLPDFSQGEYDAFCKGRSIQNKEQTAEEFFLGICNKKLLLLFMKLSGIKPTDRMMEVPEPKKQKMYDLLRNLILIPTATNPFEQAQVCAGGLDMKAVDENLQVKKYPGFYVVGELLDVDGRCGGYNLQWAFASGNVAGNHAAKG